MGSYFRLNQPQIFIQHFQLLEAVLTGALQLIRPTSFSFRMRLFQKKKKNMAPLRCCVEYPKKRSYIHVNVNRTMDKLEDEAKICYQREKRENTRDRYVIVFASYLIG